MDSSRKGDSRQHLQHRKASSAGTYLKHGDCVGPTKERICRLRSHLRTKHKWQFEILNVRTRVRTSAEGKCSVRCDGMGAGAGQVLAEFGPTAHGAWATGVPLTESRAAAALRAPQSGASQKVTQAGHVGAAAAQGRKVDVLGVHSTCSSSISSTIIGRSERGPPSRLER